MSGESASAAAGQQRVAITVRGVVQGVGFRPFVHELATRLGLHGFVKNTSGEVLIEVEGAPLAVSRFRSEVAGRPPPLARIDEMHCAPCSALVDGETAFRIEASDSTETRTPALPADVATCDACLEELFDAGDRRHRYPFLNCTRCGPRFTIVTGVPYDRERTVMAPFELCPPCRAEYDDPADRRFHAQPIACPACGPRLRLLDAGGSEVRDVVDPIVEVVSRLVGGEIVAIKGLGGYHLACDAKNEAAVAALRRRKQRDDKPFAVMVSSVAAAEALCDVFPEERALLTSPARPIVLLRRRARGLPGLAIGIAPEDPRGLGVMLPYTPIHHLIFRDGGFRALVMTSGNRVDEPIAYRDDALLEQLGGVADCFLAHDRLIEIRCDDSVVGIHPGREPRAVPLRRSRGYAPLPLTLPSPLLHPTLAVGGDLKSTFALAAAERAVLSHHLGDLEHFAALRAYQESVSHFERVYRIRPRRIVHDLHPDYASTRYAVERARREGLELVPVQHHHAHMASCMVDNGVSGPAIGVCFDGAGLGLDGTIWGGELLVGDCREAPRAAHLKVVRMPGGDAASREPWRMALSHAVAAGEDPCGSPALGRVDARRVATVLAMLARPLHAPLTSSVGRLFDAVAALAGVLERATFEGQAGMRLEALARDLPADLRYEFALNRDEIDPSPVVRDVMRDARDGVSPARIARSFHAALARAVAATCRSIRQETGVSAVVLTGGVFSNAVLTSDVSVCLRGDGFDVYTHRTVPPNDGGLSLGQMAIATAMDRGGWSPCV